MFSDALFLPHQLIHGPNHFGTVPRGPPAARITNHGVPDVPKFAAEFEAGIGKPAVIEGLGAGGSPSSGANSSFWDEGALADQIGDRVFHAGGVNFKLREYLTYAKSNCDDQPLYLFDPTFGTSAPELLKEYEPPEFFRDDLFGLLEDVSSLRVAGLSQQRPDYRWLIIGPPRSGSSFHKDPNCTSAWNAVVSGSKRWVLFPPTITPPGIHPSHDGSDVAAPVSLIEWYLVRASPTALHEHR